MIETMAEGGTISFTWNGDTVTAHAGDSLADALLRAGYRSFGASRKRHRPMGPGSGFLQGLLAEIDGIPNCRLDLVAARPGMVVRRQNVWPSPKVDLLSLSRLLPPRWLRGGFEHAWIMRSGTWRFHLWERLLAFLAGEGRLSPVPRDASVIPGRALHCDLLVIGGGPAGRAEANRAAAAGKQVVLVTRGATAGRLATALGVALPPIDPAVTVLAGHEASGIYREGRLVLVAAQDRDSAGALGPAIALQCADLVLAIGKRSIPPLVAGNLLPGVIEAGIALRQIRRPDLAASFGRVLVVGSEARVHVAQVLRDAGVTVIHVADVRHLRAIIGRDKVAAADLDAPDFRSRLDCDSIIHAGPWVSDPNLIFQAGCQGILRLGPATPALARLAGFCAAPDEMVSFNPATAIDADICPCMDVTAREVIDLLDRGMRHVEELKRQTSCGMGPCQGFPCWEMLEAVRRDQLGADYLPDRPSHRSPRRGLTVAQAAGLRDLVEPQQ
jgi:NADPH-dependent 2,4-dienoyl-CoA reductase/sulfur reductase-like enzyme/bacterioferritin-associated ferredoxin